MRKILTHSNVKPTKGKKVSGKSLTLQNDTLTIAELLRKHIQGEDTKEKNGVFIEDADHDDEDGEKHFMADPFDRQMVVEGIKAMSERLKALEQEYRKAEEDRAESLKQASNTPGNETPTEKK